MHRNHSCVIVQLLIRFTKSIFICLILIHSWFKKNNKNWNEQQKTHTKKKTTPPPKKTSLMFFLTKQKTMFVVIFFFLYSFINCFYFVNIFNFIKWGKISFLFGAIFMFMTLQIFIIFKNKISTWISAWRGLKKKIYFVCIHGEFFFFYKSKRKLFD